MFLPLTLSHVDHVLNFTNESEFYSFNFFHAHTGLLSTFKYERTHTKVDVKLFSIGDARDFNLLSILSELGDVEAVKVLLRLGFDVHNTVEGVTAMTLAYNNQHFGVVLELLKHHSLYPENFDAEGVTDEVKDFLEISDLMHKSIIDNDEEKVLEILGNNPSAKFYYNTDNNSALTCSLVRKSFKIYEHFLTKGLTFGPFEDIHGILDFLNGDPKAQRTLKRIHEKHSKPLISKHIMILISNSSVGHEGEDDDGEKMAKVTQAFQTLDKDPRLSQIMKVVAATRNFSIKFDFDHDSVRMLDPSVEGYANGLFTTSGKVLIAAKDLMSDETKHIAYGVIAHELTHFALYKTFDNNALPYFEGDEKSEKMYQNVLDYCETKKDLEEIVASAYDDYPAKMVGPEVIVRYPHILGHYHDQPDEIADKSILYGPLKTFYDEKIVPAMEAAIERFEKNADIKGKYLNARKEISLMRNIIRGLLIALLVSLVGAAIVVFIVQGPTKKWDELDVKEQNLIKDNYVDYFGVKVRFGELFDNSSTAYQDLSPHQLAKGIKNDSSGINEVFKSVLYHKVVLKWENCTDDLKHKILKAKVDFQGRNVELEKILNLNSQSLYELNEKEIKNLIEEKDFKIGSIPVQNLNFFIPRRFKISSSKYYKEKGAKDVSIFDVESSKEFVVNDVIVETFKDGIFLLVDGPGSGKSTVFKNLPESFKNIHSDYWIGFVSLKEHAKVYEESRKKEDKDFMKIIGEKILKLKGFELLVFNELYTKGKVAIFWDAFDEVNADEHQFLLEVFDALKSQTNNLQFLSSRPEHQKLLSEGLFAKVFGLILFGAKDRNSFFDEQLKNLTTEIREKIQGKIQTFIEHSDQSNQPVNNPLMLQIIADVLKDDDSLNIKNRFEVYQKFVEKQIKLIDKDRLLFLAEKGLNIRDIHKIYAIKLILDKRFHSLDIMRTNNFLTPAEVASFGLMTVTSDGKLEFLHRTYAEFFVAASTLR